MTNILVFGTSITWGAWDTKGGWVQRLRTDLEEKIFSENPEASFLIYNLGISGNTSKDLFERFEFETKQRIKEDRETIIIFDIGTNDTQFIHSENSIRFPKEKFKQNIEKLIELAKKYSNKIIFIGITCVDESKTSPYSWNKDKSWKNEYVKEYSNIIKKVCKQNNIYFIDIINLLNNKDLDDGLHPNDNGHKKIAEEVKDFLLKNKIIQPLTQYHCRTCFF